MKKTILTIAMIGAIFTASAQVKQPTFKTPLSQQDIQQQFSTLQTVNQKLHTLHLDGLLRDSLDNIISRSAQMLSARYREAFVADSLANVKKQISGK